MKLGTHSKLVLFFSLLISWHIGELSAQSQTSDTLKKVSGDTLTQGEDVDDIEETIKYAAQDSVVYLYGPRKAILYGKATVDYGNMNMQAEFIEIDYNKNLILAYGKKDSLGKNVGNPVFKDGEEPVEAEKIMYNLKTKRGKIFNALTKQGELLVIGNEIKKDSNNIIYMKDMKCIPCQEADARTMFRATRAKIIPDDKIVTGPMYLQIGGVPTPLGLPFGFFPNSKRAHSGILMPTIANSAERGFNLRQGGFYWGINDRTDMVVRGDIYSNGSWLLNTTNSYNVLYMANGYVNLSYSQFNIGDRDIPSSASKQKAYGFQWMHTQDNKSNPSVRFNANVNFVKNQTFNRFNSENSGQFLQNSFNSSVNFTKTFKLSSLSLFATHNQNAITKQMDITFPSLTFNVNRFFPFRRESAIKQNVFDKIGINYILTAQNTLSGYDSTVFKGNLDDRMKYGIKHSMPISTNFNVLKYITVTPAVNINAYMYTNSIDKQFISKYIPQRDTIPARDTLITNVKKQFALGYDATFSAGFNTKVYADYFFNAGKVKQIRHLLIPTLTYSYKPDYGKAQFGFWKQVQTDSLGRKDNYSIFQNGIYGGPSVGKINGLGINLNNTLDAKLKQKTDTGITYRKVTLIQGLSLNSSYNFAADSFKLSTISLAARTILFKNFDVNANATLDPYGYNNQDQRRVASYAYNYNNHLARFVYGDVAVNTNFGSNKLEAIRKLRKPPDMTNGAEKGATSDVASNQTSPWNMTLSYKLTLTNPNNARIQPTHALNTTADVMPTKFWKIGVTSGFDFTTQKLSYTSVNLYRDLKCWEARISWVPFGFNRGYNFSLNLKTAMLSEFKIPRKRQTLDNAQLTELAN